MEYVIQNKNNSDLKEMFKPYKKWLVRETAGIGLGKVIKSFNTKKEALIFKGGLNG